MLLSACGTGELSMGAKQDARGSEKQREAWSSQDNPALFTADLEYRLDQLPLEGEAANIPWAGSYWPTYEDNINYRWDGANSDSPAAKYGKAFNVPDVEDKVSKNHGIESVTWAKECTQASECDAGLGETCAIRNGKTKGRCIAGWWGICHAWTPAAILQPEPKRPVTRNGVTFKIQDLKALISLTYDRSSSKFVSLRCNKNEGQGQITFDKYGRPDNSNRECRDTNAGTYHLLLANYLGKMRQAFAEDRTNDYQVWNQPLRGFKVEETRELTAADANKMIGATSEGGTVTNKTGSVKQQEWSHFGPFTVAAGQNVRVQTTGTGDADLFVKFGAQPSGSNADCRSTGGSSTELCDLVAPAGATAVYVSLQGYAEKSDVKLAVTVGGTTPAQYVFNSRAVKFVYAKTTVRYITEASASTDGNLRNQIDRYTGTDRYEYILEIDANGRIVGGEWVGGSKVDHPDFLWLPTGPGQASVAGGAISFATVKSLIDESVTEPGGGGGEKTVTETATVSRGQLKVFGPYNVAAGSTLKADLSGNGDADLYARKGQAPTLTSFDCRPYLNGSTEACQIAGPGNVWVAINGYAASSTVTLTVKYTEAGGTPPPPPPPPSTITHLNVNGSVALDEMKVFELAVPAGAKIKIDTTAAGDVDLYVAMDVAPTTSTYLARAYTDSGNETLTVTAPANGKLMIGVHGYQASSFTLKTSSL